MAHVNFCESCERAFQGTVYSEGKLLVCFHCATGRSNITPTPASNTNKVKSDGGSTSYYTIPDHATELRHLISAKGMSFARGNIMKAVYRLGEKEGADILYDIKKIQFFATELQEMYERGEAV